MKAKKIKKLRRACEWYDVENTSGLFGSFGWNWSRSIRVLARNHREACYRAKKRGYGLDHRVGSPTNAGWACWRVKLTNKVDNFRNIFYF